MGYRIGYGTLTNTDLGRTALQGLFGKVLTRVAPEVWKELLARIGDTGGPDGLSLDQKEHLIEEWARGHQLDVHWIREMARDHLDAWHRDPKLLGVNLWPVVAAWMPSTFHIAPPRYEPAIESRKDYLRRVMEYVRQIEREYHEAGFRRAPRNRDVEQLEWLVAYQVNGMSVSTLAREKLGADTEVNRNRIHKSLTRLAGELALPLRAAGRRGRARRPSR